MRDPSCASPAFGGWTCTDCGTLNEASDSTCGCRHRVNVEVTMADGRVVVVEDFDGDIDDARDMVDRHYPNAAGAVIRIGGNG